MTDASVKPSNLVMTMHDEPPQSDASREMENAFKDSLICAAVARHVCHVTEPAQPMNLDDGSKQSESAAID